MKKNDARKLSFFVSLVLKTPLTVRCRLMLGLVCACHPYWTFFRLVCLKLRGRKWMMAHEQSKHRHLATTQLWQLQQRAWPVPQCVAVWYKLILVSEPLVGDHDH